MNSRDQAFKPDLYVIARIIKALIDEGPMNKTKLATFSELSYDKFANYLEWLVSRDMVVDDGGTILVLEEGVKTYQKLVEWILKYVGKLKFGRKHI